MLKMNKTLPRYIYFKCNDVKKGVKELNEKYYGYHVVPGSLTLEEHRYHALVCLLELDSERMIY